MKWAAFTVFVMALGVIAGPAIAANDLIKCKLVDAGDSSTKTPTFEILLDVKRSTGPGRPTVDEGPMLLERQSEIGEPHRWLGPLYKVVRNDDVGILGASDHDLGNEKEFESAALFYFDKKTGRAQLDVVEGADKKPVTEIGICEVVRQ
jgi:hypothetical protein